jgi:hypothetical protein
MEMKMKSYQWAPIWVGFVIIAGCSQVEKKPSPKPPVIKVKETSGPAQIKAYIKGNPTELTMTEALAATKEQAELDLALHGFGESFIEDRLGHPRGRDEATNIAKEKMLTLAGAEIERFLEAYKKTDGYPADGPVERWKKAREDAVGHVLERVKLYSITVARHKPKAIPNKTIIFVTVQAGKLFELLDEDLRAYLKGAGGIPYQGEARGKLEKDFKTLLWQSRDALIQKQIKAGQHFKFNCPK